MPTSEPVADGIFLIHDLFSPQECAELIDKAQLRGFGEAPIASGAGDVMAKEIRHNDRCIVDDPQLVDWLWQRAKSFMPIMADGRVAVGLNGRVRFYRYGKGHYFKWHMDGCYSRPNGQCSQLTFMLYLNEDCKGGQTNFQGHSIQPKTGMALVFRHELVHEGAKVKRGIKYALRTDVMYSSE